MKIFHSWLSKVGIHVFFIGNAFVVRISFISCLPTCIWMVDVRLQLVRNFRILFLYCSDSKHMLLSLLDRNTDHFFLCLLLSAIYFVSACDVKDAHHGCRIDNGQCTCAFGCKSEFRYLTRAECQNALKVSISSLEQDILIKNLNLFWYRVEVTTFATNNHATMGDYASKFHIHPDISVLVSMATLDHGVREVSLNGVLGLETRRRLKI